jgi:hypothetical protein
MPFHGEATATALARYVSDFLPETAYGVAVIRERTDGETLLGVYGMPGTSGRAKTELALYEALLAHSCGRSRPRTRSTEPSVGGGCASRATGSFAQGAAG